MELAGAAEHEATRVAKHIEGAEVEGLQLLANGSVPSVHHGLLGEGHPLTAHQVATALLAGDCRASLIAVDPYWGESTCPPETPRPSPVPFAAFGSPAGAVSASQSDGGCSTVATRDGSAATLQILIAIVGAIAARRFAKRRTAR